MNPCTSKGTALRVGSIKVNVLKNKVSGTARRIARPVLHYDTDLYNSASKRNLCNTTTHWTVLKLVCLDLITLVFLTVSYYSDHSVCFSHAP